MVIIRAIFSSQTFLVSSVYTSFEVELYLPPQASWSVSPLDERESADCQRNHKHDEKVKPAKNGETNANFRENMCFTYFSNFSPFREKTAVMNMLKVMQHTHNSDTQSIITH